MRSAVAEHRLVGRQIPEPADAAGYLGTLGPGGDKRRRTRPRIGICRETSDALGCIIQRHVERAEKAFHELLELRFRRRFGRLGGSHGLRRRRRGRRRFLLLRGHVVELLLQLIHLLTHDAHLLLQSLRVLRIIRKGGAANGAGRGACRQRHHHRFCQLQM